MPRRLRVSTGGLAYHVLNRAVGRTRIFDDADDYQAMLRVIGRTHERLPIRIISYCLMPNHWHLVLWPEADGQLSEFMRLLTVTHTQRWHAHHHSAGTGPLYQGRFKGTEKVTHIDFNPTAQYVWSPEKTKGSGVFDWIAGYSGADTPGNGEDRRTARTAPNR